MADTFLNSIRRKVGAGVQSFRLYGAGFGYANGSSVVQQTSKSTGVTLNAWSGQITMNNANLGATTSVSFTLTNSYIGANDAVYVWIKSGATAASYFVVVDAVATGSCTVTLRNYTAGGLAEAVVLGVEVRKNAIA